MNDLPQYIINLHYAEALERNRAFMLLRPRLFIDGDQWCALLGDNLQDGVAGFGKSPELAGMDFDRAYSAHLATRQGGDA